ncbi:IstB-like ATP-binding protein [Bifidobacterium bifidum]|nr:IstB-like ATP-binding protein [Bifidobacterium bifidum]
MGIHRPPVVMPDMKRRRASTGEKIETIMNLARRLPLTRQILADQLANATPTQMEFVEEWMNAELESRERSKRSRLLKQAGFPAERNSTATTGPPIRFPVDYGRQRIESLEFISGHEDLVLFGASRHRQDPPRHRAWQERMPQGHARALPHGRKPGHAAPTRPDGQSGSTGNSP